MIPFAMAAIRVGATEHGTGFLRGQEIGALHTIWKAVLTSTAAFVFAPSFNMMVSKAVNVCHAAVSCNEVRAAVTASDANSTAAAGKIVAPVDTAAVMMTFAMHAVRAVFCRGGG